MHQRNGAGIAGGCDHAAENDDHVIAFDDFDQLTVDNPDGLG